jgi:hypothetical protein
MKTKSLTLLCALAIVLGSTAGSSAASAKESISKGADVLIVRPLGFVSTLVGGTLFLVSLPVTAINKTVKPTADRLVVGPAKPPSKGPSATWTPWLIRDQSGG